MYEIKDKIAVVTGAASGIGLATTKMLLEKGAKVVMADYNAKELAKQEKLLKKTFKSAVCSMITDVSKEAQVKALIAFTVKKYKAVDIMVNNAGISGNFYPLISKKSIAEYKRVFDVNVNGTIYGGKYAAEQMVKQGRGGAIVNTSSMMGVIASQGGTGYCGSKHAIMGITKSWALELAEHNIRVNALCPGYTMTGMINPDIVSESTFKAGMAMHPLAKALNRVANPDEMAHAICFMIENTYMTGQYVVVDGGYTIH